MKQRIAGIEVHIEGEGAETIVMVHGWPDTCRLWDAQVAHLRKKFRCVRFTLPGFDAGDERRAYTLDELTGFIKEVINQVSPGKPVVLLLHDWGCLFGYQFYVRQPERVAKIIGVDIGDTASLAKSMTAGERLMVLAYQLNLAAAWKIGGRVGDGLARFMARVLRSPSEPSRIHAGMGYPYYMTWFGGAESYRRKSRAFVPVCPMLFVYAKRKPLMFHARSWAEALASRPGNQVVAFDTGHWVMTQQPEKFNQVVDAWLSGES